MNKSTRDPTKEEFEDIQDTLWTAYPDEVDKLYTFLYKATGKEPRPALVVRRFKDEFPTLFTKVIPSLPEGVVI